MPGPDYIHALLEGNNPSENPPTDPPWDELARLLLNAQQSDRPAVLDRWIAQQDGSVSTEVMSGLIRFRNQEGDGDQNTDPPQTQIWSLDQFITEDFGRLPVLVGEENNALLVAGEGMFIVGTRGAGKTNLCMDFALRMAAGLDVVGFQTAWPLNVLVLQAELPAPFFQHRFNRMVRGYEFNNGSDFRETLSRVHIVDLQQPPNLCIPENRRLLSGWVEERGARVLILDPFLSFFRGDENANPAVHEFLDSIKFEVALPNNCGVIVTDHVAKADTGKERSARGAGTKEDWASTIISISAQRDPSNPDARIVSARISKQRYGPEPPELFLLRRDPQTLLHSLLESDRDFRIDQIRQLLVGEGGEIRTQTTFIRMISDHLEVGGRLARKLLENAMAQGIFVIERGRNNSSVYRLANRQVDRSNLPTVDGGDE